MAKFIDNMSYSYEVPHHLTDALEQGNISSAQSRELIEIEVAVPRLTFEEDEE